MTINNNNNNNNEELPPPYTIGEYYSEAPYDKTDKDYNWFIGIPDHSIIAIDSGYVTNKHIKYFIKEGFSSINENTTVVLDDEGRERFSCAQSYDRLIFIDSDNIPILNIYADVDNYSEMYIYKGNSNRESFATIRTSSKVTEDILNFEISIYNEYTDKIEELEMKFNKFRNFYGIYCNTFNDEKVMIGSIKKSNSISMKYTVEVAPSVDYMLLLGLGILVIRLQMMKKEIRKKRAFGAVTVAAQALTCVIS